MEWLIIILLVANLALVAYFLWKRNQPQDTQGLVLLQGQMQELAKTLDSKLGEGTNRMFESMRAQFGESQRLASDIRDLVANNLRKSRESRRKRTKRRRASWESPNSSRISRKS